MGIADGIDLAALRDLQARALDGVARRWAHHSVRPAGADPSPGPPVADGLATLCAALGPEAAVPPDSDVAVLRRVVAVTGGLAEAARRVATAAAEAPVGWPGVVEVADAVSTTAQALRMIAEIELAAMRGRGAVRSGP